MLISFFLFLVLCFCDCSLVIKDVYSPTTIIPRRFKSDGRVVTMDRSTLEIINNGLLRSLRVVNGQKQSNLVVIIQDPIHRRHLESIEDSRTTHDNISAVLWDTTVIPGYEQIFEDIPQNFEVIVRADSGHGKYDNLTDKSIVRADKVPKAGKWCVGIWPEYLVKPAKPALTVNSLSLQMIAVASTIKNILKGSKTPRTGAPFSISHRGPYLTAFSYRYDIDLSHLLLIFNFASVEGNKTPVIKARYIISNGYVGHKIEQGDYVFFAANLKGHKAKLTDFKLEELEKLEKIAFEALNPSHSSNSDISDDVEYVLYRAEAI